MTVMDWETEDGKTFKGLGVFPKFQQTGPARCGARCPSRAATPLTC